MPRRRGIIRRALSYPIDWRTGQADAAATTILNNTLQSACRTIGADHGFMLLLRDERSLEVACAYAIAPREVMDVVFGSPGQALQRALFDHSLGLADREGKPLCHPPGSTSKECPTTVAVPLDIDAQTLGVMCLIRQSSTRCLSLLDLELLEAFTEQASLALRAMQQQSALSRLSASLNALMPRA